ERSSKPEPPPPATVEARKSLTLAARRRERRRAAAADLRTTLLTLATVTSTTSYPFVSFFVLQFRDAATFVHFRASAYTAGQPLAKVFHVPQKRKAIIFARQVASLGHFSVRRP